MTSWVTGDVPIELLRKPQFDCQKLAKRANSRQAPETNSMTVSLSGLDLTTPQGLREARERLTKTAQHLCRRWADSRKVDDSASYALCTEETIAKALSQLPTVVLNARN
jgi:UrcA family protein